MWQRMELSRPCCCKYVSSAGRNPGNTVVEGFARSAVLLSPAPSRMAGRRSRDSTSSKSSDRARGPTQGAGA